MKHLAILLGSQLACASAKQAWPGRHDLMGSHIATIECVKEDGAFPMARQPDRLLPTVCNPPIGEKRIHGANELLILR